MADARLGILLVGDSSQAQKALNDYVKALGDAQTKTEGFNKAGDGLGDGVKKKLTVLESAFIDAIKPIDQLEAEIAALNTEIGKTTDFPTLKKYSDQIGKLTTQMNNMKVVGFETTLGKVNASTLAAASTFQQKFTPGVNAANTVLNNTSRIFQDLPFGIIGVANNINPLVESFGRLKQVSTDTGTSIGKTLLKSLAGPGGLALTFGLVTAAAQFAVVGFSAFTRGLFGTSEASKKAAEQLKKQEEAMNGIIQDVAKEVNQVQVLVQTLKNETLTRQQRINAIKELERIAPQYFATLNAEKSTVDDVVRAYDRYLGSIQRLIEGKVTEKELLEVTEKRIKLERELNQPALSQVVMGNKLVTVRNAVYDADGKVLARQKELTDLRKLENDLVQKLARLQPPDKIFAEPKVKVDKSSQNDIIQTAKFLESQFVFDPSITFNPLDTDADELRKARRIINDFFKKPVIFKVKPVFDTETEPPKEQDFFPTTFGQFFKKEVEALQNTIKNATESTDFTLLQALLNEKQFKEFQEKGKSLFSRTGSVFGEFFGKKFAEQAAAFIKANPFIDARTMEEGIGRIATGFAIADLGLSSLNNNFGSFIDNILQGENAFKSFGQLVMGTIRQVAAELLKAIALAAILSLITGGKGAKGGLSFLGALGKIFGGARAGGGPVASGRAYLVGENGPEMFFPTASGTIIPNGAAPAFAGIQSGGLQPGSLVGIIQGRDLALIMARQGRYNRDTT